jgi:hypothetical protein
MAKNATIATRLKLIGVLAARSPRLRLALGFQIERYCSANEELERVGPSGGEMR